MNMLTDFSNSSITFRIAFNHHTYHCITSFSAVVAPPVMY